MKVLTILANLYMGDNLHNDEEDDVFVLAIVIALWLLRSSRNRMTRQTKLHCRLVSGKEVSTTIYLRVEYFYLHSADWMPASAPDGPHRRT